MATINSHYQKLKTSYLFPKIEQQKQLYKQKNPNADFIDLGIGDITDPLLQVAYKAYLEALDEMQSLPIGYGPSQGYSFLREKIQKTDYGELDIDIEEIFISNGAKCDCAHLLEIFSQKSIVALCDPSYPVYVDSTVMSGKTGSINAFGRYNNIVYLPLEENNHFMPLPPLQKCHLIYLCSPNNPTGVALTKEVLEKWVNYARKNNAIILYDGAYEAFISQNRPKSIYEIEGAKEAAIEIRSFSKTAGFTGLRCSYTVIPKDVTGNFRNKKIPIHSLWERRHNTKFGGVCYLTQKAAAALYTSEGQEEIKKRIKSTQQQTDILRQGLLALGYTVYGGIDAPYLWVKTPAKKKSWDFFSDLLSKIQLICIPGEGFGSFGEGFIRLSSFAKMPVIKEALKRLQRL